MKRNAVLVTAVLFCLAVFATASEHKKESAPQSQNAPQQNEMYGQYAEVRMDDNAAAKAECAPQAEPKSTSSDMQEDPEGDSQASQNQAEYGGAG